MSWDDDEFEPKAPTFVPKFDDEQDAKGSKLESWDDEEEQKPESPQDTTNSPSQRFSKVSTSKHRGRQKISAEEAKKEQEYKVLASVPLTAEQKKAAEAAEKAEDYKRTQELFSGCENLDTEPSDGAKKVDADNEALFGGNEENSNHEKSGGNSVDTYNPQNLEQFNTFAQMLAAKITPHKDSYFYTEFVKSLLKEVAEDLEPEEIKELGAILNVITNKKIKNAQGKKGKKGGKKAVVKKEIVEEDMVEEEYDGYL